MYQNSRIDCNIIIGVDRRRIQFKAGRCMADAERARATKTVVIEFIVCTVSGKDDIECLARCLREER